MRSEYRSLQSSLEASSRKRGNTFPAAVLRGTDILTTQSIPGNPDFSFVFLAPLWFHIFSATKRGTLSLETTMTNQQRQPDGDLLLRTLAMPGDTNPNGDIFGGWILSQMDIGGGILAKEIADGRTVTVAIDGMAFYRPVNVGDVVCCYGHCTRVGNSSMTVKLEVWVRPVLSKQPDDRYCVTEAIFTYVAVDDEGKPRKVPRRE